ncbi:hypothetical protein [Mycolicibacterium confluentis]|uniref:Uncharacterized protein n=1 Tax=Mycolicibacterium confluentis TaxID=28047 RepID=A0A7I7XRK4_9MYCO|nr:hypothetical protein [Mycolicibacterium confluentis]MCV7318710.1 hypothetical protein [Mycolicibacterium confluentis]ORV23164.1 hypothetical protein AWB99_24980 [Mycolicibacterium confluentis]BBZ31858.1 hypothetical protein MCNF_04630 [Mycolicibacterium confluentis]
MRVLRFIVPALVAGGAAVAIAAAPAAVAAPTCEATGGSGGIQGGQNTVCSSPGNVQIDSRPSVYAMPWYGDPFFGAGMVF